MLFTCASWLYYCINKIYRINVTWIMSLPLGQQFGEALLLGVGAFVAGKEDSVCEGGLEGGGGEEGEGEELELVVEELWL